MSSAEWVPAAAAVSGGAALVAVIAAGERRREQQMRASRVAYAMRFPSDLASEVAVAALSSLTGLGRAEELVLEAVGDERGIRHLLHVPASVAGSVIDQLTVALPGVRIDRAEPEPDEPVVAAMRVSVPSAGVVRVDGAAQAGLSILQALGGLRRGEWCSVRWSLRAMPASQPASRADGPRSDREQALERALRARLGEPGFACEGIVLVRAQTVARARALAARLAAVYRSRRGVGSGLQMRPSRSALSRMPRVRSGCGWLSTRELVALLAWPLGVQYVAGLDMGGARVMRVPREVSRHGRRLFAGVAAHGERPVALSPQAAQHHMAVVGPSGTGKSALLTGCILDDLASGFGGVVIDPKGDLASDVLDRIPDEHAGRVVVLDPSVRGAVPGLDLLRVGDPDLRADVVLGALAAIFKDSWGVRTDTYLRLGLRTLSELPRPVLSDWLRLFTDPGFRTRAISRLQDPMLIGAWQSYEALSRAEQQQHVAAPMAKVVSLLSRPAVRGVLAQSDPKLNIPQRLAERRWLVVTLSPGTLGEPAARLLGAVLTYAVWTAIEARSAVRREQRASVFLYVDELQTLAGLPFGLESLFERARGLGCGVSVATQALGRLPESVRQSLLGNVGTLVAFRLGHDEAARVARELPGLDAKDLQALGRFEVAARVSTGLGSSVAVITGTTNPPAAPTGQAARIRRVSAERYGQDVAATDAQLRQRREGQADANAEGEMQVGRTRRAS